MATKDPYNNKQPQKRSTASQKPVTLDSDEGLASVVEGNIPTITLGDAADDEASNSNRVTMPTASSSTPKKKRAVDTKSNSRKVADISEMATGEDPRKTAGVDLKKSPQDEILKPGGPFDKYVEGKKEEYYERMKYEDEKRALEQYDNDEGLSDDLSDLDDTEYDDEEAEILSEQGDLHVMPNIKLNSVSQDDSYDEVTTAGPMLEPEHSRTPVDDPSPFYTTIGYEDPYQYPDSYNLPEDEDYSDDDVDIEDYEIEEEEEEVEEDEDLMLDEEEEETEDEDVLEEEEMGTEVEEPKPEEKSKETESGSEEIILDDETGNSVKIGSVRIAFTQDVNDDDEEELEKEIDNVNSDLPTEDERLEELKTEISRKLKPKATEMNLKGFTIASKSTASSKILEMKETSAGKWVLPTTGVTFEIREISGQKVESLREYVSSNTASSARNALKIIYDHIVSPKPTSFEQWTKSIAYADYDHLFYGIYLAAFSDSNYMPMTCVMEDGKIAKKETGCGKMFLTDNLDPMKLIKFKDDESKKKFWDLYNSDRTNSEGLYASEVIPVSNDFAIAFCEPTLYSVLLENNSYGRDFSDKYDTIIAFMPYIKDIYWIDHKNMKLVPISYQKYENNSSKTAKSKVIRYSKIFDTFSTDEYTNVVALVNSINEDSDWFTYVIPEVTCPECGRVIPEEEMSASGLVFTRHRLGILANTSIK